MWYGLLAVLCGSLFPTSHLVRLGRSRATNDSMSRSIERCRWSDERHASADGARWLKGLTRRG